MTDSNDQTAEKKNRGGRPKGTVKDPNKMVMTNGVITPDRLFTYVKPTSIPKDELQRFIQLCDKLIISLGPTSLREPDIEEIALLYRDRIYVDTIYERFVEQNEDSGEGMALDTSMLKQIETLSRQLEERKSNLSLRFKDSGKSREDYGSLTLMDVLSQYTEKEEELKKQAEDARSRVEDDPVIQDTGGVPYMERHLKGQIPLEVSKEETEGEHAEAGLEAGTAAPETDIDADSGKE